MIIQHASLAAGRWQELTLLEQLGNIGSDVGRAARAQGRDQEQFRRSFVRALELFDFTLRDSRWKHRLKEIARARELFCAAALGVDIYHTTLSDLDRYFLQFALAARRER